MAEAALNETSGRGSSWLEWITDHMARAPGPTWLAYVVLALVLAGIAHASRWIDGGQAPWTL